MPTVPIQIIPLPPITRRLILVLKDVLILKIDALLQGIEINTQIIGHISPTPIDPTHSKPDLPLTRCNRMYLGQTDLGHVPPSRDRNRSASAGRQEGNRNRSRERDQYRQNSSRSPSAGRKSHCPYCGKGNCRPGECSTFFNTQFSQFPCNLCPTALYHRTSAHRWMV